MSKLQFLEFYKMLNPKPKVEFNVRELTPMYEKTNWFIEIKKLRNGESFGELALIKDDPRAATITATEKAAFIVIDREAYLKVLLKIEQKGKNKIDTFLKSIHIFEGWSRKQLKNLHLLFEQR